MGEFILRYWVQELFVLIIAFITWMFQRVKLWKKDQEITREGMVALLHDRLYQACSFFIRQGYCTLADRNNLEYLYIPYKALGGNGTGENLYETCMNLPYNKPKEEGGNDNDA